MSLFVVSSLGPGTEGRVPGDLSKRQWVRETTVSAHDETLGTPSSSVTRLPMPASVPYKLVPLPTARGPISVRRYSC
jgi:hypothetical protein